MQSLEKTTLEYLLQNANETIYRNARSILMELLRQRFRREERSIKLKTFLRRHDTAVEDTAVNS